MQFLTPLFLLGSAALAVPLILHLVRKEKSTVLPFPSLMFLKELKIKEKSRRRLKYLALLSLRCLALLLLVAAFAKPVVTGPWLGGMVSFGERSVLLLFDQSLSMSRPEVWDSALQAGRETIESLEQGDELQILLFGTGAEVVTPWLKEPSQFLRAFEELVVPGFEGTAFPEALRMAVEQLSEAENPVKELVVVSDLQREGLGAPDGWKVPAGLRVSVRDVGLAVDQSFNVFVEDARVEREVFGDRYPYPITVRVSSSPPQAMGPVEAVLYLNGQPADRVKFELDPGGSATLTFKPFELEEAITRGRIALEVDDALAADNDFYFVCRQLEPRSLLILSESAKSAFYLENALASGTNQAFQVSRRQDLSGPLTPDAFAALALNDLATPPPAERIRAFVEAGGGLLVGLGSRANTRSYSGEWRELLGAELGPSVFVRNSGKPFSSITDIFWEHPVFSVFQDVYEASVISTQFYGYRKLQTLGESVVLARFQEGDAALVENRVGSGRVITFTSSFDNLWTDFPLRAAYVPLWSEIVHYSARLRQRPASVTVGATLNVAEWIRESQGVDAAVDAWNVLDPDSKRIVGLDQERPDFVALSRAGFYEVRSNRQSDWVASNTDATESDLEKISETEFLARFVTQGSSSAEQAVAIAGQPDQQQLWPLLLIIAAVLLLLEPLLANRYLGESRLTASRGG